MHKIIVAGIPRSGTTYVFNNLGLHSSKKLGIHQDIMKTHGLAPPETSNDPKWYKTEQWILNGAKSIFVFGDPVLSVISTKLHLCNEKCPSKMFFHYENCGHYQDLVNCQKWNIGGEKAIDLFCYDGLHYEKMFDSWMKDHPYPVLSIRYETIPLYHIKINDFVGCKVEWTEWVDRSSKYSSVSSKELEHIKVTYASLIEKVEDAPDVFVW